jgi:hypothetical protein
LFRADVNVGHDSGSIRDGARRAGSEEGPA